ncbi:MAG: type II secretion system protein GspD [Planctomycetota bacterium]
MTNRLGATAPARDRRCRSNGAVGLRRAGTFLLALVITVYAGSSYVMAAQSPDAKVHTKQAVQGSAAKEPQDNQAKVDSTSLRCRVVSLKHIPAERGKQYLADAKIGTVSQLPGANMLLVTDLPSELVKASAILRLVDSKEDFVMTPILTDLSANEQPSNQQIADRLGDIVVGTFSSPPQSIGKDKAIIDVHNGTLVAVASQRRINQIISAFQQPQPAELRQSLEPAESDLPIEFVQAFEEDTVKVQTVQLDNLQPVATSAELGDLSDANQQPNGLFSKLLESLADAEKKAAQTEEKLSPAEPPKEPEEPNEPPQVEPIEQQQPSDTADVDLEPIPDETEPPLPRDAMLAAILQRLEALEAGLTTKLAPPPEPEPIRDKPKTAPKIEQPNEPNLVAQPSEANELEVPVSGQNTYDPGLLVNGDDVLTVNLPEKLPLIEFLSLVSKQLQLDILYDPAQVTGEVTLKLRGEFQGPLTVRDLYMYLVKILQFHHFAMTRTGNLVTVRPMIDAAILDPPIVGPGRAGVRHGDVVVTKDFKLEHIDTASAETLLNSMQLGIKVVSVPEAATVIVTGFTSRMGRIEQLLKIVDKPGEPKKFRFRQLTYTMAESLAPKIKTLAEELGTVSVTISAPAAVPKPPTTPRGRPPRPSSRDKKPQTTARRLTDPRTTQQVGGPAQAKDTVYLEADQRTNRVLMIGHKKQLDIVEELISTLDVEQQDLRSLRLYEIQNVDAEEVRMKLEELGIVSPSRTAGRGTMRGRQTRRDLERPRTAEKGAAGTPTRPTRTSRTRLDYGETEEAPVEEPQVVVLETINALLVNATTEQHARIAMIIGYVDSEAEADKIPYVVYPLENQDPVALAEVLNKLIQETSQQKDPQGKIVGTTTQKRTDEDIVIIADENTFALIVYASKKNQQWIANLIEQLDKRRPQVLIDVTLVQITKEDAFNLDLDVVSSIPNMAFPSGMIPALSDPFEQGVDSGIFDLLKDTPDRNKFVDLKVNTGRFTGFYGDNQINALVKAMQTKNYGRVMARPKLLVNDNEQGTIQTTQTTYVQRTTANVMPGVGTGGTVSTQQTVFEDYSAGITMDITPHISEGDMLRLEISLNRSDFTENISPDDGLTKPPNKADEDVATIVTVPDQSTIILGGMERISHSKGGKKIPILGDLPLIGALFRDVKRSGTNNKLYIFVKAHILRPNGTTALADLKDVSRKNREAFERLEKEMSEYHDWPGIKPTPLDPPRILEAD